ncbi:MAG: response regulator [Bacteroidota bacterium]|nr:response regulator [Bacteroidota bacterium]
MVRKEIRILMIDDDKDDFMIVRDIIKDVVHHKYTIDWRPSYEEGLKSIAEKNHDVYLIDYRLGAKTGLDLVKRAIEIGCEAPLIILTGENNFEIDNQAMNAGAADYIVKAAISGQMLESSIRYAIANTNHKKEMQELNAALEKRVKSRTISLEETLSKLKKSQIELIEAKNKAEIAANTAELCSRSKTDFLSCMSHEIRTPLNAIIGFTNVVFDTNLTKKQKEYLNAIKTSGNLLMVLINDILDLAKVEAGKMTFEYAPFNLSNSISEILQLFETKIKEAGLQLAFKVDPTIPEFLIGDSVRLNQIILNLVSNAIKFTKKGKISIEIHKLNEDTENVTLAFSVTDTGIGIPQNNLNTIFDKFQQATTETSNIYGGTGLGLTIAKQLVELQGGTISVKSKVDKGSTFSFILSYKKIKSKFETETKEFVPKDLFGSPLIKNVKILVAEDESLNQLLISTLLEKFGFEIDIAGNGKIVLEKLKKNNYDVVLMDLQMPEMNGFETTYHIRNGKNPTIPIIALTANVTTTDVEKCRAAGMNDYISKPINTKLLYTTIIKYITKEQIPKKRVKNETLQICTEQQLTKKKCINLDNLNELTNGNLHVKSKIAKVYMDEIPKLLLTMKQSMDNLDWDALRIASHSLIPSFALMGINKEFETMARTIEKLATRKENLEKIKQLFQKIDLLCTEVCFELKNELIEL